LSIIASFADSAEQSLKEITESTGIPKGTIKKYLPILVEKGELEPIGEGRGRYYRYTNTSRIEPASLFKSGKLLGFLSYQDGRYCFEYDKSYRGKRLDTLTEDKNFGLTIVMKRCADGATISGFDIRMCWKTVLINNRQIIINA